MKLLHYRNVFTSGKGKDSFVVNSSVCLKNAEFFLPFSAKDLQYREYFL